MAITLVQNPAAVAGTNITTIVVTLSSTAAGSLLVACIARAISSSIDIVSVVDSAAVSWTAGPGAADANNGADIYYRENAGAGVTSVTVTFDALTSSNNGQVSVFEIAGAATSSALGQTASNTGSETDTTINLSVGSFTPNSTASIILVAARLNLTPTTGWTAGSTYTLGTTISRLGTEYKIRAGAGTETAPLDAVFATSGARTWAEVVAEFVPPAAGGTTWPGYQSPFGWR